MKLSVLNRLFEIIFVRFYCQSLDLRQQANHPAVRMVSEDGLFLHYIG